MGLLSAANLSQEMSDPEQQAILRRKRKLRYVARAIRRAEYPAQLEPGWYILKELKGSVKVAKDKPADEILEDEIWMLLSDMGFAHLSSDRHVTISYGGQSGERQQIDVLAVDDECALVVECKSTAGTEPRRGNFKEVVEAIGGKKAGIIRELRTLFRKPKLKVSFILATRNYQVSPADTERMSSFAIRHFGDRDIDYYRELTTHLGQAARYQFNADLFAGQDIPELENRVPAIEGKMGGRTYYSFSASPELLLKLGFVLHRTKSVRLTPSYQRLIKKSRLTNIQTFVEGGGYFPNSLLVNIETGGRRPQFDRGSGQGDDGVTKLGVLHLPPRYRSIYVIDGQHRLYAYSGSKYSKTNSLPVVAFVNLDRREQLRLFMEINENQKAVNRNLKNTLDADLKWDSDNLKDRADGLKKQLALDLGDEVQSPLFGRVQVGEDEKTSVRNITLEAILKGLNRTSFVGKFTRTAIVEQGIFAAGSSDKTLEKVRDFLFEAFAYSQERLADEWRRAPEDGALLTINAGITAYIWLLNDLIVFLKQQGTIDPLRESARKIVEEMSFHLDGFVEYIKNLSFDERTLLRTKYGSGADTRLWRCMQKGVADYRPEFQPEGLAQYWRDQSRQFNIETFEKVGEIEQFLKEEIREALEESFGNQWLKKGIPAALFEKLHADAAKKNREIESPSDEKRPWDCMYIINYRDVLGYGANWSTLFQKRFTIPGQEKLRKDDKTAWLTRLNAIRNQNTHEHSVSEDDYKFTVSLHEWLINDDPIAISDIVARLEAATPTGEA